MVAVVLSPSPWAVRMTASHSFTVALPRAISERTASERISAPPPGMLPSPASFSRPMTSASGIL